jgi:hypothetical protein
MSSRMALPSKRDGADYEDTDFEDDDFEDDDFDDDTSDDEDEDGKDGDFPTTALALGEPLSDHPDPKAAEGMLTKALSQPMRPA